MCKHKLQVECVHIYDYLLSIRGVKSLDKDGLKNIGDVFNSGCIRVTCYNDNADARQLSEKRSVFIDFENGRVLMVRRGYEDESSM
jgi:hypothetical protein